ncbi:MAG: YigZ family protein [Clostridia bacterium]|nr:YigZ family protein [Clostridia bacterium]
MKEYRGVKYESINEIEIQRSRFICELFPVHTQDEAENTLNLVRESYKDATHHCFAYIVGEHGIVMRMSDDGEPQGTSGPPMLEVLKKRGLSDTLAVVTRYFGGIKLGANGLVGAYSRSVSEALDKNEIVTYTPTVIVDVEVDYTHYGKLTNKLIDLGAKELEKDFSQGVKVKYAVREESIELFSKSVAAITSGSGKVTEIERKHYIF